MKIDYDKHLCVGSAYEKSELKHMKHMLNNLQVLYPGKPWKWQIKEKNPLEQAIDLLNLLNNGMDLDITWRGEEIKGTLVTPELMERINLFLKEHHNKVD